jgi:tetratricopeptide (TPR) repeat protein
MRITFLALAAGLGLLSAASVVSFRFAEARASKPYDVLHVPSGAPARVAALGHRTFVSDLYWLSAVQYIGESHTDERGWDKLLPLIELVTDLDPRHGYAYQTAGIVLSAAGLLDESDAILKKGLEKGPPYWTFPYYLAFNAWFYRGDLEAAAKYAEMAARLPDASANVSHLAVSLASKSGTPSEAIAMLEELRKTVKDEATSARIDEQLRLATVERDAQALERAVAELENSRGWPISSLDELVLARPGTVIPPDPHGGRYVWDLATRKVRSSANPFRFEREEGSHVPHFQYRPSDGAKERSLR